METKRIIEMFELIKYNIINDIGCYHEKTGICQAVGFLLNSRKINDVEYVELMNILNNNKPTEFNEYSEFIDNDYWSGALYWWDEMYLKPETQQIRIDYLTALINNIK